MSILEVVIIFAEVIGIKKDFIESLLKRAGEDGEGVHPMLWAAVIAFLILLLLIVVSAFLAVWFLMSRLADQLR